MASDASGVSIKDLSPSEYTRLSRLLDEVFELPTEARAAWLRRQG